jgi:GNAT superfamily N-acetyltransferase
MLSRLTQPDQRLGCALIAMADRSEVAGVAQYELTDRNEAEAAVVVGERWRRVGVASLLLSDLAVLAAANGVEKVRGDSLRGNDAAIALARNLGCVVDKRMHDPHALHVVRAIGATRDEPEWNQVRAPAQP